MVSPNRLAEIIVKSITGNQVRRPKVININKKCLSIKGDLSFQLDLDNWKGYVDTKSECFKHSENILQYYFYFKYGCANRKNERISNEKILSIFTSDINEQLNSPHSPKHEVVILISKAVVIVNYKRPQTAYLAIRTALERGSQYGIKSDCGKKIHLTIELDPKSEMTSERLRLQRLVAENLLKCHGCVMQKSKSDCNYMFTIKSEGPTKDNHMRYVCGSVLNSKKKKERELKVSTYLERKIRKIKELSAQKMSEIYVSKDNFEKDVLKIANATINHELLSIKHTSPVILADSNDTDSYVKEASFVLYNNVRINAILDKYAKLVNENKFHPITPIERFNSFDKTMNDDSWALVYNYIIKYPDVLDSLVTLEPKLEVNIHMLWLFVSSLCHDFSKYYRRNRILLTGSGSNNQVNHIVTERLHMLRALGVILSNILKLLNVEEVSNM